MKFSEIFVSLLQVLGFCLATSPILLIFSYILLEYYRHHMTFLLHYINNFFFIIIFSASSTSNKFRKFNDFSSSISYPFMYISFNYMFYFLFHYKFL